MCGMGERDAKTGLFLRVLLMALWAGAALAAADADGPADLLTAADFLEWERVSEPRISPDGARVLFTRGWVDRMHDRWESEIWIMGSDGGDKRFLTKGSSARWSPDGTRIAYLAEGEPSGTQIFVLRLDAPTPTQVTRVERPPASLRWSPQGDRFAFVMRVPPEDPWTVDLPPAPEGATWTEPPRIVDGVYFRQDRRGFMQDGYVHLFVVEADGGTPRQLTRGRWNVGARTYGLEFGAGIDWTPDGRYLVFDGLREDDASRLYRRSHLYAVEVASREVRRLTSAKGPWTGPIVSPDGKHVAFTGYPWTLQTYRAQDVWVMGMDGSEMRAITAGLDRDAADLHWLPDGSGVAFTAGDRGSSQAYVAPLDGSGARAVTFGTHMLSLGSVSRDGNAVGVLEAPHEPGDVVRYALERGAPPERLTAVHADVLEDRTLGEVEEILARSPDGTEVQGWLVKPPRFDPEKAYPLILHIHGGPHAMYNVSFNFSFQFLAAHGYLVLYTNPRGSTGYGTDFGNAIDNAYPSVDYDDLMASVDAVVKRGYVDTDRMYVTGVSGGGVLSSWTIAHTDRFAAAAVRAPVIDWISFAGTTDITEWAYARFDGYFWDDPSAWLEHSPLMHVGKVRTPTLMMCGELDLRTPMGQTEEYFQALNALGIPTKLIRFHEEYHGTGSKPSNFLRTQLYLLDWFGQHVKARE